MGYDGGQNGFPRVRGFLEAARMQNVAARQPTSRSSRQCCILFIPHFAAGKKGSGRGTDWPAIPQHLPSKASYSPRGVRHQPSQPGSAISSRRPLSSYMAPIPQKWVGGVTTGLSGNCTSFPGVKSHTPNYTCPLASSRGHLMRNSCVPITWTQPVKSGCSQGPLHGVAEPKPLQCVLEDSGS